LASIRDSVTAGEPSPPHAPRAFDPFLYCGTLLLRQGNVQEALRLLSDANRIYGACPFVHWQLGAALLSSGKETPALRALQKAVGPSGLPRWVHEPQKAWTEAFPGPDRGVTSCASYVHRLAEKHVFRCPVFGHNVAEMV